MKNISNKIEKSVSIWSDGSIRDSLFINIYQYRFYDARTAPMRMIPSCFNELLLLLKSIDEKHKQ